MKDERRDDAYGDESRGDTVDQLEDDRVDDLPDEVKEDVARLEQQSFAEASPGTREDMRRFWRAAVVVVALILAGFHLYTAVYGIRPSLVQGSFHLALGLALIFLLYPSKLGMTRHQAIRGWVMTALGLGVIGFAVVNDITGWHVALPATGMLLLVQASRHLPLRLMGMPVADLFLALAGACAGLYVWFFRDEIERRAGLPTDVDVAVGVVGMLLILLATQRVIGTPLVVVATLALLYA